MLSGLLLIALLFGLIQEVKFPGKVKIAGFRVRKQSVKRSALVTVAEKPKS